MCVKLRGSQMSPGQIMAFMTKLGKASGTWGFNNGLRYNARLESMDTAWRNIQYNRGIISANSFWEGGKEFIRRDGELFKLGIIYNDKSEFAVITSPANDIVKPYHHRMPLVLEPTHAEDWLDGSKLAIILNPGEFLLRAA